MKTQLEKIKESKKGMSVDFYIAAFKDGSVSEPISMQSVPSPLEGDYVRIFKKDTEAELNAKLGSML